MQHFYGSIQGWFKFQDLYKRMVQEAMSGDIFVEVGCWKGRSAAFMAVEIINSDKDIEFHCVDTFKGSDEPAHHSDPDVQNGTLFQTFVSNLSPVIDRVGMTIHAMPSVEASRYFDDGTVDFILLDAAHDYDSVKEDIRAWHPKLREGGTLAGDDYNWEGVQKAVKELLPSHEILGSGKGRHWSYVK